MLVPGTNSWQYVKVIYICCIRIDAWCCKLTSSCKPLPGHAICNIGDSLAIYSGGVLFVDFFFEFMPVGF